MHTTHTHTTCIHTYTHTHTHCQATACKITAIFIAVLLGCLTLEAFRNVCRAVHGKRSKWGGAGGEIEEHDR